MKRAMLLISSSLILVSLTFGQAPCPNQTYPALKGTVGINADGSWTLTYKPAGIGTEYFNVTLTDMRPTTNDAKSVTGTLMIVTIPANREPRMGCGARP